MNTLNLTPTQLLAGLGVLLTLLVLWRFGARRARAAADAARSSARLVSLTARVLFNASLIVAAQWAVVGFADSLWLRLAVLGLPALFASFTLTKSLTVTTVQQPRKRGGRR